MSRAAFEKERAMIDKRTTVEEVLTKYPQTVEVFDRMGLGCAGCSAAVFENIEQCAAVHGVDADELLENLKEVLPEG